MSQQGYAYACSRDGERHAIKIGFTDHECPDEYLHSNYSRSLHPLEVLKVMPCGDSRLAEKTILYLLDRFRIHPRHELVNLSDVGLEKLMEAFDMFRAIDNFAQKERPTEHPLDRFTYRANLQSAEELLSKNQAALARKLKKEAKETQMQQKQMELFKREQEAKKQQDLDNIKKERLRLEVQNYVGDSYVLEEKARISTSSFYDDFNNKRGNDKGSSQNEIAEAMKQLGYTKKRGKVFPGQRTTLMCYFGLRKK